MKPCGFNGCNRRHHKLLHGGNYNVASSQSSSHHAVIPQDGDVVVSTASNKSNVYDSLNVGNTSDIFIGTGLDIPSVCTRGLLKVLPVVLEGPRGTFDTFALLDEGSTATLIDGNIATRIGAETTGQQRLRVNGIGGMFLDTEVSYVNFHIQGRDSPKRHLIQGARSITPLCLAPQSTNMLNIEKYHHLADISNLLTYENATPTVLIGAADWYLSASREMRVGRKDEPVATKTVLGWVLHGAVSTSSKAVDFIHHMSETDYAARNIDSLEALVKTQYEIDSLGIQKHVPLQNSDVTRAVNLLESSARRLSSGRFEVGLPWKENVLNNVPDSYPQALSRLNSIEKQMAKDEPFASAYKDFVDGIIQKGYAEECDSSSYHKSNLAIKSSTDSPRSITWYLPHFGVYHPQKRKLRVVHDAAATTRGVSLNSMLLQGPDLLQPLLDILFRFREGPIAFNADIREMFPQIKIREQDRDALRFLWRDVGNTQNAVKEFRMSSVVFGAVSSPFIALFIKNKNAKEYEHQYPAAVHSIIHDHYMDDYIGSEFELSDAARLASDIVTVHKSCSFEMRSWVSNVPEALNLVPKELHSDSNADVRLPPNSDVGALGVKWNPFDDTLGFRTGQKDISVKLTKRALLSSVMSVYDPLGLLMPIVIRGRILIQKLWREGSGWDSPICSKYEVECREWFDQLASAASLRIPRCYESRPGRCDTELHVIADGGEQAYACVAYWRYTFLDGSVSLALIGSKARVAPLKPLSIPRLELQAAVIATRFAQAILSAHRTQPSAVHYWTDSTTVLKWIRSDARNFKAFVAHRLGEILELTNPSNWRWLPSELNIADDATKPKRFILSSSHRWFAGPSFLLNSPSEWPCESECVIDEASRTSELKPEFVGLLVDIPSINPPVPDATRFSSWLRLLRATARVFQAVRNFWSRSRSPRLLAKSVENSTSLSQLSVADMIQAEKMLYQRAQADSFAADIKNLKALQPLPKTSPLAALAPVLDTDGLVRLDSRIRAAPGVSENAKAPIILDGRHRIVHLIILHKHAEAGHGNNELILNEVRQKYWILRARSTIRSVARGCLQCRRQNGRLITPPTGNLPLERLDHHTRPFTHVGLDYFGAIEITVGRRREKRYVALYTCLVTRALHLEVVTSLSSDAAIMSLRRLIARRGTPLTIYSDNGTNFVGANRELTALYDGAVENFATSRMISWRFIPPASPFMGGAWERMVRSVKTALRATLKDRAPREEVLTTLLLEAEAMLNCRPLTYVPNSTDAPEAITPFHFILGSSSGSQWPVNLSDADLVRRCDWRRVLRLADHFWARWLKEYLPTLIPRGHNTGRSSGTNVCEGDVVLIADSTLPRGLWLLGRIVKTFTGADGLVRVADVATKGGTLRRPVRKLLPLVAEPRPVATRF